MINTLVDGPSPELARGLRVGQAMAYSPRPENPPNLHRPRDTNIKSAGIAFVDLRSTLCSQMRIAAQYYQITPPLEHDQN